MKKILILSSLLIVMLFVACKGKQAAESDNTMACIAIPPPPSEAKADESSYSNSVVAKTIKNKKIIKNGKMTIEVKNVKSNKEKINLMVKKYNSYFANEQYNDNNQQSEYILKIRIPAQQFDLFIKEIEAGQNNITYKNIEATDVTEEFIDLETRLNNKRNYLIRYNELLKKANSVKDILEIEDKTRVIEEEIESAEGRLKFLNNQVEYSTLELNLVSTKEYIEKPFFKGNFFSRFLLALKNGWYGGVEFLLFIFRIWPVWILTILVIYIIRRIKKRKAKK